MANRVREQLRSFIGPLRPEHPHQIATSANRRRLYLLLVAIVIMGWADLALTLTYMRTIGMFELNPLARMAVESGQGQRLVLFKLLTMAISAGSLLAMRHHRCAERVAWCSACLMLALMVQWRIYNESLSELTYEFTLLVSGAEQNETWVRIES